MSWALWIMVVLLVLGVPQLFYLGYVLQVGFNALCADNARMIAAIQALHDEVRKDAGRNARRDDQLDHPERFAP